MVDKNDPLLREVNEELRREQWAKLWEEYGTYFLAGAALIVVLVGGFKFWEARQKARAEASGAQYEAALALVNQGKTDAADRALEEIAAGGLPGYSALAELTLAGSHLKAGQRTEALAIFDKLANDPRADELISSYAALQAAAIRIQEGDYAEIEGRLAPLARDDGPWRYGARELIGTAALKAGKLNAAREAFAPLLSDPKVPESVLERVRRMMAEIAASEVAKASPASPTAPPAGGDQPATPPASVPN